MLITSFETEQFPEIVTKITGTFDQVRNALSHTASQLDIIMSNYI